MLASMPRSGVDELLSAPVGRTALVARFTCWKRLQARVGGFPVRSLRSLTAVVIVRTASELQIYGVILSRSEVAWLSPVISIQSLGQIIRLTL
jgi:hypothetical protein